MNRRIPVAAPVLAGREREYVLDCLDTTWISSSGRYVNAFETGFAEFCGSPHGIACCNGTVAAAPRAAGRGRRPGRRGDRAVADLCGVREPDPGGRRDAGVRGLEPGTWNLDPEAVAAAITPRTKAIEVVHLYGHPADMDPIMALAREHGLTVIEDAAEAHGAEYRGRRVGAIGDIATFSFYGNKIITTGEGGMVLCHDDATADHVRQLRGQGQDPQRRYWFPILGFNYRMTNVAAAIGLGQLEMIDWHIERRREIAGWYAEELGEVPELSLSPQAPWARSVYWINCMLLNEGGEAERDEVMRRLDEQGIETRPFFYPVHTLPMYTEEAARASLPVAESLAARGINLPSGAGLTRDDVAYVGAAIRETLAR